MIDWNKVLADVVAMLAVALIPYLAILVGKLVNTWIAAIKAPAIRHLAYDAVNWAQDKFGPDSASGKVKLAAAVAFLVKKTGISEERADVLIRSAYQQVFAQFPKEETPAA